MASEKLSRILRSKTALSEDEISSISDEDGWKLVYANKPASNQKHQQVCFTGFNAPEADELRKMATDCGWLKVASTVTTTLTYLCLGDNPGPAKLEKARAIGSLLLNRDQFIRLLADGELPAQL